jgi:hypothetical protein
LTHLLRVTITSIVRLVLLVQGLYNIRIFPNMASNNVGFVISAIETNLALITASAPALRPIFRSRDRGGWFARSVMATTRGAPDNTRSDPDVEMGQKPIGWDKETETSPAISGNTRGGGKLGSRRGGKKPGSSSTRRRGRSPLRARGSGRIKPTIIRIKTDRDLAELRSSPRSSEEQAMTNNGLVRVSDIQREIDGIVKDIAVAGAGSYTGGTKTNNITGNNNNSNMRPTTPKTPVARPRPSIETITIGATMVTPLPPRPSTSGSGVRRVAPERYYSEIIYPEQGLGRDWEDGDDDRVSKYLDRRFGVVTPRGTTPTSKGWEGSGRPF